MAYQIGFDLYESATQQFLQRVQSALRAVAPIPALLPDGKKTEAADKSTEKTPIQESTPAAEDKDKNESAA